MRSAAVFLASIPIPIPIPIPMIARRTGLRARPPSRPTASQPAKIKAFQAHCLSNPGSGSGSGSGSDVQISGLARPMILTEPQRRNPGLPDQETCAPTGRRLIVMLAAPLQGASSNTT